MWGDPKAEMTVVFATLQTAAGPSPQSATSAGVPDRNNVTASTSLRVNQGKMTDGDCMISLVPLLLTLCFFRIDLSFTSVFMTQLPCSKIQISNSKPDCLNSFASHSNSAAAPDNVWNRGTWSDAFLLTEISMYTNRLWSFFKVKNCSITFRRNVHAVWRNMILKHFQWLYIWIGFCCWNRPAVKHVPQKMCHPAALIRTTIWCPEWILDMITLCLQPCQAPPWDKC